MLATFEVQCLPTWAFSGDRRRGIQADVDKSGVSLGVKQEFLFSVIII